jgi:RNA polymerase sigma factor (sigma-70 family)
LASQQDDIIIETNPLQETVEDIIENELTEEERELFHLKFGERMSYRDIAKRYGYSSHMLFQVRVEKIVDKVREALERKLNEQTTTRD